MTGTIIKSERFHIMPYWVVKCDKTGKELPIDQLSLDEKYYQVGKKVEFELVEIGNVEEYKLYAKLK